MFIPVIVANFIALLFVPMALMGILLEPTAPKTAPQPALIDELREK